MAEMATERAAFGNSWEVNPLLAAASHTECRLTRSCQMAVEISNPTVREERASCGVGIVTKAGGMLPYRRQNKRLSKPRWS